MAILAVIKVVVAIGVFREFFIVRLGSKFDRGSLKAAEGR